MLRPKKLENREKKINEAVLRIKPKKKKKTEAQSHS
jgi:hypothetical protein